MGTSAPSFICCVSREAWLIFKMVDEAKVKYVCDIYDWDGKGEIDLFFLGDICYALGLNITKKACVGQGQTDEEGKKNSPSTMMLSRRSRPLLPPLTPRDPTTTMLRSSRRMSRSFLLNFAILRMRMACSHT